MSDEQPARPTLRLVRGDATPEEIAVIVALLAARSAPAATTPPRGRSLWSARARSVRPSLTPGPGAWRASALPR